MTIHVVRLCILSVSLAVLCTSETAGAEPRGNIGPFRLRTNRYVNKQGELVTARGIAEWMWIGPKWLVGVLYDWTSSESDFSDPSRVEVVAIDIEAAVAKSFVPTSENVIWAIVPQGDQRCGIVLMERQNADAAELVEWNLATDEVRPEGSWSKGTEALARFVDLRQVALTREAAPTGRYEDSVIRIESTATHAACRVPICLVPGCDEAGNRAPAGEQFREYRRYLPVEDGCGVILYRLPKTPEGPGDMETATLTRYDPVTKGEGVTWSRRIVEIPEFAKAEVIDPIDCPTGRNERALLRFETDQFAGRHKADLLGFLNRRDGTIADVVRIVRPSPRDLVIEFKTNADQSRLAVLAGLDDRFLKLVDTQTGRYLDPIPCPNLSSIIVAIPPRDCAILEANTMLYGIGIGKSNYGKKCFELPIFTDELELTEEIEEPPTPDATEGTDDP